MNKASRLLLSLKKHNKIAVVFGILAIWNVIGFLPVLPGISYYALLFCAFLYNMSCAKKINMTIGVLLLYIPIEILIVQPSPIFKPWERFILFTLLLGSVSFIFESDKNRVFRKDLLIALLNICMFLGSGSAICFYLGINFMQVSIEDFFYHVGVFGGLTRHSMLLGPIAGFGVIYSFYLFKRYNSKSLLAPLLLCCLSVLFSASRASLAATACSVIVLIYKGSKKTSKFLKTVLGILAILCLTYPLWSNNLSYIIDKNNGLTDEISFDSREDKWNNRIEEFKNNPIWGVGFASVDTNIETAFNSSTGVVETGSSWLMILSMTGLLGAFIMFFIIFGSLKNAWSSSNLLAPIVVALLCFFFVHMLAEGFIFSGGSFLCLMFWLFIGCAYDLKFQFPKLTNNE